MNGLLFLAYCIHILGPLLCGAQATLTPFVFLSTQNPASDTQDNISKADSTAPASQTQSLTGSTSVASHMPEVATTPAVAVTKSHITSSSPSPTPHPTTPSTPTPSFFIFYSKECLPVFMVAGGLILLCVILLISTLVLMCKMCQLKKHIKMLSSNADQISTTNYWVGTAKKNQSTPETEAKETTVLMTDISQTVEEVGNGTTKEDGGKVNEEGQTGEDNKKEAGDTAKSEEASTTPATVAEDASSSKPQEEATDSQPTKAEAASSSTGTEEPKDAV
ncbi:uncharacterized protein LOC117245779 [Epinephelus lanceolatus]|uniref:uncharacterized protein LOC117245779 n=1 Tax=Epinephelus lanceolatus TaxID=310571 RepID=UPI001446B716|nr:uncharacterized protein LOC117245779 [Epinephelus lanceolatus]